MGETQIDIRRIETLSRYGSPPWKPVDVKQYDVRLSVFEPGTSSERYRRKWLERGRLWQTRQDIYGRIKDGRKIEICYRQRRAHDQAKDPTLKHSI
jgi:hypothetical protein